MMSDVQVTINPVAAEAVAAPSGDPKRVIRLTDARGRAVAFRRVTLSRRLHVIGLLGEDAGNSVIQFYALMAAAVTEIAGDPVPPPMSRLQLDALLDRLEDETLHQVGERYAAEFIKPTSGDDLKNA
jgi:hypothetical protein